MMRLMGRPKMPPDEEERALAAARWLFRTQFEAKELKRVDFAKALGISQTAVKNWLDHGTGMSHENLRKIAARIGASADDIRAGRWQPGAKTRGPKRGAADPRIDAWAEAGRLPEWLRGVPGPSHGGMGNWTDAQVWEWCQRLMREQDYVPVAFDDELPMHTKRGTGR